MDTMGKRYCWTRRAELALGDGDAAHAVDIVDRLVASAPGMSPEGVITYLWKLKGDALVELGQADHAEPLLRAALGSAREHRERFLLWRLQASLGRLYRAMNREQEAERAILMARELVQELAEPIPDQALKDTFLQRARDLLSVS